LHEYPDAQSLLVTHCCWQAPFRHLYGEQLVVVPSGAITVKGSTQVPPTIAHWPVAALQLAPVAQSLFERQVVAQAWVLALQP
jgi:hypothetical protein